MNKRFFTDGDDSHCDIYCISTINVTVNHLKAYGIRVERIFETMKRKKY